jgi:predicted GIY-YIG superfamily endonuclease
MVERERQLKGWSRRKKLALIHTQNPEMIDYARQPREILRSGSLRSG